MTSFFNELVICHSPRAFFSPKGRWASPERRKMCIVEFPTLLRYWRVSGEERWGRFCAEESCLGILIGSLGAYGCIRLIWKVWRTTPKEAYGDVPIKKSVCSFSK